MSSPATSKQSPRKDHDFTGEYKLIVERELSARFVRQLPSITGVSAKVLILPADTLPRATHKAKRVEDRRTGVRG